MARQRLEKRLAQDEQWGSRVQGAELKLRELFPISENEETEPPLWYRVSVDIS